MYFGPDLLDPIIAALQKAGEIALSHRYTLVPRVKSDGSMVTDADIACESHISGCIQKLFPDFAILGEEGTSIQGELGNWLIDPIDGTGAYLEGLAHWGPTLGLKRKNILEFGISYFPLLGEYWWSTPEQGLYLNNQPFSRTDRNESIGSLYLPSGFHIVQPIPWPGRVRALGSTAAHMVQVLRGSGEAAIISSFQPWDVIAALCMAQSTQLCCVDFSGAKANPLENQNAPFIFGTKRGCQLLSSWTKSRYTDLVEDAPHVIR